MKTPQVSLWSSLFGSAFLHAPTPYLTSQIWILSFTGLMPNVLFWPLTSQKLDFKQENEHCPKSSFGVPPNFQQTGTSILLPGAAGLYPGSLDPCCSFSSHLLPSSSLCDSICPAKVQYLPHRAAVRPLSGGGLGTTTIHGTAHQHSQTLSWHIHVGKNQEFCSFFSSDAKIWGISINIPQARLGVRCGGDQIQEFLLLFLKYMKFPAQPWTKGFCPTLPSHHQPPNHLFYHKPSLWIAKFTEEWCKCTFCLYKWCQCFLCHSPGCPTALQEQLRKRLLVAVWKDVQGKVILK